MKILYRLKLIPCLKSRISTVGELCGIDDSDYLKTRDKDDSIMLGQYRSSQHPRTYADTPSMQFTITEVKMPFLYDFVVDRLYNGYERRGYNSEYEYVEVDATAWGANTAWQLFKDGKTEMKSINSFRGDCDVRVWLCQIAKNCYTEKCIFFGSMRR